MRVLYHWTWKQLNGDLMVKVQVKISHLAINRAVYKTGDILEVTPEKAAELVNAVNIIKDETVTEQQGVKKAKSP